MPRRPPPPVNRTSSRCTSLRRGRPCLLAPSWPPSPPAAPPVPCRPLTIRVWPAAPPRAMPVSATTGRASRTVPASGHLLPTIRVSSRRLPRTGAAALLFPHRLLPHLFFGCRRRQRAEPPCPTHVRRPCPIPTGLVPAGASRCQQSLSTLPPSLPYRHDESTTTQACRRRQPSTPPELAKAVRVWAGVSAADNGRRHRRHHSTPPPTAIPPDLAAARAAPRVGRAYTGRSPAIAVLAAARL